MEQRVCVHETPGFADGMHPSSDRDAICRHASTVPMILIGSSGGVGNNNS